MANPGDLNNKLCSHRKPFAVRCIDCEILMAEERWDQAREALSKAIVEITGLKLEKDGLTFEAISP